MTISDLCAEMMKQNFTSVFGRNYSKLAIALFLKENNFQIKEVSILRFCKYFYRFYRDNKNFRDGSNYVIVKNIEQYMPEDMLMVIKTELNEWVLNGQNVLLFSDDIIYTNPLLKLNESDVAMANTLLNALIVQNFGSLIEYDESVNILQEDIPISNFDEYILFIKSTKLFSRGFESLNYCCCCDKTGSDLVCMHINPLLNVNNPDNTLIFCREHAYLYFRKYFTFLKSGKIKIEQENELLDNRMHLSRKVLLEKRNFLNEE